MNQPRTDLSDEYADFVEHPRYGRGPQFTGLNLNPLDPAVHLHWNSIEHHELVAQFESGTGQNWPYGNIDSWPTRGRRIEGTAIPADLSRQTAATFPVTHYFDLKRTCRDCRRPFIFFALEQKYWYEELGFGLDSDCVRCTDCRKQQQEITRLRKTYETLYRVINKTDEQHLQMADACLSLIEKGLFTKKQLPHVRMLLNSVPETADIRNNTLRAELFERTRSSEKGS